MQPLISIVLCTYNGELFVKEQLVSLLEQPYCNIEIIISDDASTDSTPQILKQYENIENIKIFYGNKNSGITNNISFGLKQCKGEFIALSDQDDIWKPEKIQLMFDNIKDDILIYSDSELINEDAQPMHKKLSQLRNMHIGNNVLGFAFNNCTWGHAILFKSSLLTKILPIPYNVPHDSWIGFIAAAEKRINFLDIPLTLYRQHEHTFTSTLPTKPYKSDKYAKQEDYLKRLNWLKALSEYHNNPKKNEYQKLFLLFSKKEEKKFVFKLFFFIMKYFHSLFAFSKKKKISKINEARKLCRGIKIVN
ncbi:MAG: glycosyltransferase [Chitinophagaceae bacterium]|nr:glycosyltransferase [Chitinophagaceae bacterium]